MKRVVAMLAGIPALTGILFVAGCNDGNELPPPPTGTPAATRTATKGAATATATVGQARTATPTTNVPLPSATATTQVPPTATATGVGAASATPTATSPTGATETPTETPTTGPTEAPTEAPTVTPTQATGAAACGNGVVDDSAGEGCDDGGYCLGGPSAGQRCPANQDGGVDCGGATCRPIGGDGCAANCQPEDTLVFTLDDTKSISDVKSQSLEIPLHLAGKLVLRVGRSTAANGAASGPGGPSFAAGDRPVVQKLSDNMGVCSQDNFTCVGGPQAGSDCNADGDCAALPPINVSGAACACVRGFAARSCGGTLHGTDCTTKCSGGSADTKVCQGDAQCPGGTCVSMDSVCPSDTPCDFVHGPGNSASGLVSCNGGYAGPDGTGIDYVQTLQSAAPLDDPTRVSLVFSGATGGPGAAVIVNSTAIGTIIPSCDFDDGNPSNGTDGFPCTDDDPNKGNLITIPLTTGTARSVVNNADQCPGNATCAPSSSAVIDRSVSGMPFNCAASSPFTGAGMASAFGAEGDPPLNDTATTTLFVAQ